MVQEAETDAQRFAELAYKYFPSEEPAVVTALQRMLVPFEPCSTLMKAAQEERARNQPPPAQAGSSVVRPPPPGQARGASPETRALATLQAQMDGVMRRLILVEAQLGGKAQNKDQTMYVGASVDRRPLAQDVASRGREMAYVDNSDPTQGITIVLPGGKTVVPQKALWDTGSTIMALPQGLVSQLALPTRVCRLQTIAFGNTESVINKEVKGVHFVFHAGTDHEVSVECTCYVMADSSQYDVLIGTPLIFHPAIASRFDSRMARIDIRPDHSYLPIEELAEAERTGAARVFHIPLKVAQANPGQKGVSTLQGVAMIAPVWTVEDLPDQEEAYQARRHRPGSEPGVPTPTQEERIEQGPSKDQNSKFMRWSKRNILGRFPPPEVVNAILKTRLGFVSRPTEHYTWDHAYADIQQCMRSEAPQGHPINKVAEDPEVEVDALGTLTLLCYTESARFMLDAMDPASEPASQSTRQALLQATKAYHSEMLDYRTTPWRSLRNGQLQHLYNLLPGRTGPVPPIEMVQQYRDLRAQAQLSEQGQTRWEQQFNCPLMEYWHRRDGADVALDHAVRGYVAPEPTTARKYPIADVVQRMIMYFPKLFEDEETGRTHIEMYPYVRYTSMPATYGEDRIQSALAALRRMVIQGGSQPNPRTHAEEYHRTDMGRAWERSLQVQCTRPPNAQLLADLLTHEGDTTAVFHPVYMYYPETARVTDDRLHGRDHFSQADYVSMKGNPTFRRVSLQEITIQLLTVGGLRSEMVAMRRDRALTPPVCLDIITGAAMAVRARWEDILTGNDEETEYTDHQYYRTWLPPSRTASLRVPSPTEFYWWLRAPDMLNRDGYVQCPIATLHGHSTPADSMYRQEHPPTHWVRVATAFHSAVYHYPYLRRLMGENLQMVPVAHMTEFNVAPSEFARLLKSFALKYRDRGAETEEETDSDAYSDDSTNANKYPVGAEVQYSYNVWRNIRGARDYYHNTDVHPPPYDPVLDRDILEGMLIGY